MDQINRNGTNGTTPRGPWITRSYRYKTIRCITVDTLTSILRVKENAITCSCALRLQSSFCLSQQGVGWEEARPVGCGGSDPHCTSPSPQIYLHLQAPLIVLNICFYPELMRNVTIRNNSHDTMGTPEQ